MTKISEPDMIEEKTLKTWEWVGEAGVSTPMVEGANSIPLLSREASRVALAEGFLVDLVAAALSFIFDQ